MALAGRPSRIPMTRRIDSRDAWRVASPLAGSFDQGVRACGARSRLHVRAWFVAFARRKIAWCRGIPARACALHECEYRQCDADRRPLPLRQGRGVGAVGAYGCALRESCRLSLKSPAGSDSPGPARAAVACRHRGHDHPSARQVELVQDHMDVILDRRGDFAICPRSESAIVAYHAEPAFNCPSQKACSVGVESRP